MRNGCNLSVDQLHNILISEPCEEGTYRDSSMTSCEKCDTGKEPNTDKTDCGEKLDLFNATRDDYFDGGKVLAFPFNCNSKIVITF